MSDVYSNELEVEVSTSTEVTAELTSADSPVLEIILDPWPDVLVYADDVEIVPEPSVVELVTDVTLPVVDIVTTEQPVIDIVGEGMPGPKGPAGPSGPQGPQGPPGSGAIALEKTFAIPSTAWVWDHNLNTYAIEVNVFNHNDQETLVEVEYPSPNQIIVHWYYPESGRIRIIG